MDKQFWITLANNDYRLPGEYTLENLTDILFSYLGSTDPELRDDIAYTVYANWLKRDMYPSRVLESHIDRLLDNLDEGIGETESDTVFLRAFSMLLLAEVVHNDNKKHLLEGDQVQKLLAKGLWYLEAEKDPRGYIPVKGWAHALAHTADLMLVLARNRYIETANLKDMLAGISSKFVHSTNHVYIHGEDERIAAAVVEILRRGLIPFDYLAAWMNTFSQPDGKDWKGVYMEEERNRAFQNTRNLLRSIYFQLLLGEEKFPGQEQYVELFLNTLKSLRAF